jgi:hypothetical protein
MLKQEDQEFEASLGYSETLSKTKQKTSTYRGSGESTLLKWEIIGQNFIRCGNKHLFPVVLLFGCNFYIVKEYRL